MFNIFHLYGAVRIIFPECKKKAIDRSDTESLFRLAPGRIGQYFELIGDILSYEKEFRN